MKNASVRLGGISIHNFKNVLEGSLSFINTRKAYKASIVGLYGQNGSGKTALIDALELLKYVLCGRPIPEKFRPVRLKAIQKQKISKSHVFFCMTLFLVIS